MGSEHPFTDQVSLMGKEADVYEAIATLEYLGRPVRTPNIVSATKLDQAVVSQALRALTERGILVEHEEHGQHVYEPGDRGWSTAPEQSAGPQR